MAAGKNKIEVTLSMRDLATRALREFRREVEKEGKRVERQTEEVGDEFDEMADDVKRETRRASRAVDTGSRKMRKDLDRVQREARSTGGSFAAFAKRAAVALVGIETVRRTVGAGFGFVQDAAAAEETLNRFTVVFGNEAKRAEGFVQDLSATVGRSTGALRDYSSQYQNLLTALGLTEKQAAGLSLELTKLQLDLASFADTSDQEVATRLFSGLVGEAEAVRRFGVDLSQAAIEAKALELGIEGGAQALTQQQKVLIRTRLLFENTTRAQGDLVRTQDSFQNQIKRLNGRLDEFRVILGQEVIAVLQDTFEQLGGVDRVAERIGQGFRAATVFTIAFVELARQAVQSVDEYIESAGGIEEVFERGASGIDELVTRSQKAIVRVGFLATTIFNTIATATDVASVAIDEVEQRIKNIDLLYLVSPILARGRDAVNSALEPDRFGGSEGLADDPERRSAARATSGSRTAADIIAEGAKRQREALEGARALIDDIEGNSGRFVGFADSVTSAFTKIVEKFRVETESIEAQTREAQEETKQFVSGLDDLIARLAGGVPDSGGGRGIPIELFGIAEAAKQAAIAAKAYREEQQRIDEQRARAQELAERERQRIEQLGSSYLGARDALTRYGESLSNYALAGDFVSGVFRSLEQGVQSFSRALVDGSQSAGDAVKRLVQDIGALIVQMTILSSLRGALGFNSSGQLSGGLAGLLAGLFGGPSPGTVTDTGVAGLGGTTLPFGVGDNFQFAKGGIGPGPLEAFTGLPVNQYASGGIASSPQIGIFGEGRQREAFVPLPDGRRIPVDDRGGGGTTTINLRVESVDPTRAADVVLNAMPEIRQSLASALASGSDRKLTQAVRSAGR